MNIEQITFRIEIERGYSGTCIHFIDDGSGFLSVKIGELVMSLEEFGEYVKQLNKVESRIRDIQSFANGFK